jgi:hypothetical protein
MDRLLATARSSVAIRRKETLGDMQKGLIACDPIALPNHQRGCTSNATDRCMFASTRMQTKRSRPTTGGNLGPATSLVEKVSVP